MELSMKLRKIPSKVRTHSTSSGAKQAKKRRKQSTVKSRRCVCAPSHSSIFEFPKIWEELLKNGQLCDGVVRCEDGTEFKIHRAILSAVSPYFKALFTNSINRGQPETTEANMKIPSSIFKFLLDFAYTGTCDINETNVEALLKFADQYEILGVLQMCCKYLMDEICPSNCLGILRFAGQYFCTDLARRGRLYVRHNFLQLLKESCEFHQLTFDELLDILKDDELNVKSEALVYEAIKEWVNFDVSSRKEYLLELLKSIRLGHLSFDYVSRMSRWNLIEQDEDCKHYMSEVLVMINDFNNEEADFSGHYLFKARVPYDILFAVGGWSAGSPTNFVETYDTRADKWLLSVDTDCVPRAYHGLCTLKGLIYMIGGFDGNEYFNTVRCFDPVTHSWSECACMYYPRCYVSVVMHEGKIYAMGGYNGRMRMSSAERYDPRRNQWELIASMQKQRSDASAAALANKIYIVGGFNGQEVMNSAEVFDCNSNQWSYIPSMISARSGVSLITFKNTLYAIGGFNGYTRLATGERFEPESLLCGSWTEITEMMTPRSNFATVILDDFIYVIGGFNDRFVSGSTTINYVEYYDAESNEWYDAAPMNLNRSALSACVISGLPNARDYSLSGRNKREVGQGAGLIEV